MLVSGSQRTYAESIDIHEQQTSEADGTDGTGGPVTDAVAAATRRDSYRQVIESDPQRKERFAQVLERIHTRAGVSDDLDEIDRLLTGDS